MYADISPFKAPASQRVNGRARLALKAGPSSTRLDRLFQDGSAKIRLPKTGAGPLEAVLINTAGGLTGGDRLDWRISLADHTHGVATSQACEKVYRSTGDAAEVSTTINVGDNARFDWLPQETILFDQSCLNRSLDVELAASSRFLALEAVVLGRQAMGETVTKAHFHDRWRIRRDGRLVHAEDILLDDDISSIGTSAALLNGNRVFASIVYISSEDDERLEAMTTKIRAIRTTATVGASSFNGKIVVRLLATDSYLLRADLMPILKILRSGHPLPRVWKL